MLIHRFLNLSFVKFQLLFTLLLFNLLTSFVPRHQPDINITLSEVMFDPTGSEFYDEFVEIYNLSQTDSINLTGWQIGDSTSFDEIVDAGEGLTLPPGTFGLILDAGYFDHSNSYDDLIPDNAVVLTIDGATFGRNGWTNSVSKHVVLLNPDGQIVDSYSYSVGNQAGHSDEKIILSAENELDNWADSQNLLGTPGFRNSVSPGDLDISLELISSPDTPPQFGVEFTLSFVVRNIGVITAKEFRLIGTVDHYSLPSDSTYLFDEISTDLSPGDSLLFSASTSITTAGSWRYYFECIFENDENTSNNSIEHIILIPYEENSIVVNEWMYFPNVGEAEWIELYNPTSLAVNLQDWQLSQTDDNSQAIIITDEEVIQPKDYLGVSSDSGWVSDFIGNAKWLRGFPSLRNNGGELFLFDASGKSIDAARYEPAWGKQRNFSLERRWAERSGLDSSNWKLSEIAGGTAGRMNNSSPLQRDLAITGLELSPNPISYQERAELNLTLTNSGREPIDKFEMFVFIDRNSDSLAQPEETIHYELVEQAIDVEDSLQFSVQLPNLPSGYEVISVLATTENDNNGRNNYDREILKIGYEPSAIVINEIMYRPFSNEPEWIEFYNRSSVRIQITGWSVFEKITGKRTILTEEFIFLNPGEYLVVAGDSLIINSLAALLLVPKSFPSLNNDEDHLQLQDFADTIIDDVFYTSGWGGESGVSLERINPELSSQDSSNWASSASVTGSTIGEINSVFVDKLPQDANLSSAPNPFSPDGDGHEDVTIIQYNLPVTTAFVSLKVFDMLGREVADLLNNAPSGSHRELIWDGRKGNGESLPIGIYILFLKALNQKQGVVRTIKKTVVIAGRL